MNCKPGDLAVIVGPTKPFNEHLLGRVVRVTAVSFIDNGEGKTWCYEKPLLELRGQYAGWRVEVIEDRVLRPIRDNDGQDQTLTWVPKREGVTA